MLSFSIQLSNENAELNLRIQDGETQRINCFSNTDFSVETNDKGGFRWSHTEREASSSKSAHGICWRVVWLELQGRDVDMRREKAVWPRPGAEFKLITLKSEGERERKGHGRDRDRDRQRELRILKFLCRLLKSIFMTPKAF